MGPIRRATADLPELRLVFNNAGFILPGIFHRLPLAKQLVNMNCNATAAVCITHHFLRSILAMDKVVSSSSTAAARGSTATTTAAGTGTAAGTAQSGKRGLITFTSSSAGFLPTPIASLYGATKTFLTSFACAVATEVQEDGVDVLVVHPSPIASRFYEGAQGIGLLTAFQRTVRWRGEGQGKGGVASGGVSLVACHHRHRHHF